MIYSQSYTRRPYGKDSYRTISHKMDRLEPFAGNSMRGCWESLRSGGPLVYVIYSYATIVGIYDPTDRTLYENVQSYSPTTSQHQHTLRYSLGYPYRADYHVECHGDMDTAQAALNLSPTTVGV